MSMQTEKELAGKRSKAGKAKVKIEEFEKCKQEGKCYKCYKDGLDVNYKEYGKHNKNLTIVSTKTVNVVSKYSDFLNAFVLV